MGTEVWGATDDDDDYLSVVVVVEVRANDEFWLNSIIQQRFECFLKN